MPTFAEQLSRYFLGTTDVLADGEQFPHTSEGNLVEYLIDGQNYFGQLKLEIEFLLAIAESDAITGNNRHPFFYIHGWWLGLVDSVGQWVSVSPSVPSPWRTETFLFLDALALEDGSPDPAPKLIDKLEEMAEAGIDVRVLGWVSPLVLNVEPLANYLRDHAFTFNINTIQSIQEVRNRIGPGNGTLMTLAHPLGASHHKTIVAGTDDSMRAYVAGIDLVQNRIADNSHTAHPSFGPMIWHDAGARIEGPAADSIYSFYRALWNEQIDRVPDRFRLNGEVLSSHFTTQSPSVNPPRITPPIAERSSPIPNAPGPHHVQVLRTVPRMSISFANPGTVAADFIERILVLGTTQRPMSFAPNGLFEFRPALHQAITAAERYIYIEDQSFSAIEVMEWINQRLRTIPELKVIFVWGPDPNDPPTSYPHQAISNTLIPGVSDANARIRIFHRKPMIVHSKITIVDDVWAAVGSANCMRRSLYTDLELSVSVMEDSATPFARLLRKDLWGELCGLPVGPERDPLLDLDASLAMIEPSWSTSTPPPGLRFTSNLIRLRLPFEYADPPAEGQWKGTTPPVFNSFMYDIDEADSR